MLSIALKLVTAGIVLFLAYKAVSIYALFQFAEHMRECLPASAVCRMIELKVARSEIDVAMGDVLSCARQKQTSIEAVFLPIPTAGSTSPASSTDTKGLMEMCRDWGTNTGREQ